MKGSHNLVDVENGRSKVGMDCCQRMFWDNQRVSEMRATVA